jgi:hypothetical protein
MKSYRQFIKESKTDIDLICQEYYIKNYTINSDGSVDVNYNVRLNECQLTEMPLKFGIVTGDFYCVNNQLTSLEGTPREVSGDFSCSDNLLTSLEGGPNKVGGYFNCFNNYLTSLHGSPISLGGHFSCRNNKLTSLVGCPENIRTQLYCPHNEIIDFRGISEFFEGDFHCENNPIFEIWKLFNDVRCIRWINEFDVIRGKTIVLDRLEEVFHQLGFMVPQNINLPSYEII